MSPRRRARRPDDRGATLVELTIVGLLVLTMFLALFEFGLLFRDNLTTTDAVADATRVGGLMGPDVAIDGRNADFEIVRAVREGLSAMDGAQIRYIVVFKGTGTSDAAIDQVPAQCKAGTSISGICNAYPADAAFAAVEGGTTAYFTCPTPPNANIACRWDPATREDGPTSADVETVGVYVRIEKDGYTGLFADRWTIERASTIRLEPGLTEP
ncbi:MAG: pilus assembly protein [Acidimicrobiales bacterium]|nr:pilus assembly protein [Acidimicrobiales bacterium]